jgi:hypothetical protein
MLQAEVSLCDNAREFSPRFNIWVRPSFNAAVRPSDGLVEALDTFDEHSGSSSLRVKKL